MARNLALEECLRLCREKTGVETNGMLARFLPDLEGFAIHHACFTSAIRSDPEWVLGFLMDEILTPKHAKTYPPRTRLNEKLRRLS